jgi:hypothetical protein
LTFYSKVFNTPHFNTYSLTSTLVFSLGLSLGVLGGLMVLTAIVGDVGISNFSYDLFRESR